MAGPTFKADGDQWRIEDTVENGRRVLVFFCTTSDQRPYRVLVVGGADQVGDLGDLDREALEGLFEQSRSMGAPTDYPVYA